MAVPWLNREMNKIEWGVGCNGCRLDPDQREEMFEDYLVEATKAENILYLECQFMTHLFTCAKAMRLLSGQLRRISGLVLHPEDAPACGVAGDITANVPSTSEWSNEELRDRRRKARVVKIEPGDARGNAYW